VRSFQTRWLRWAVVIAIGISSAACLDDRSNPLRPPPSRASDGLPGAATYTVPFGVAATNDVNNGSFGPVPAGLLIPARSRFILRVTGLLTVTQKPDLPCEMPAPAPGIGTYGPRGYNLPMGLQAAFSASGSFISLFHPGGDTLVLQSDTMYTPIAQDLLLWRQGIVGAIGCAEGSSTLYEMSGTQDVTVEVVEVLAPNEMILSPNPVPRQYQGDTVHFAVQPKYGANLTGENLTMRAPDGAPTPYAWSFTPDSSNGNPAPTQQVIPGCYNDRTCNFKASVSGTIKVYGSFSPNSYDPVDSVMAHVDVIPCPWKDDPVMDSPDVRRRLTEEFKLSDSLQLERGGVIFRNDSTGAYDVVYSSGPYTPTQCRFDIKLFTKPGFTQVGIWHTHPAKNTVLTNCPTRPPGSRTGAGRSSPWDFAAQKQVDPLPAYVMDRDDIYRIRNKPQTGFWSIFGSSQAVRREPWKRCLGWASFN